MTITRRDFLAGVSLAVGSGLAPRELLALPQERYYPPALTGLRGSHPGAFETAHQVGREGRSFDVSGMPVEDHYDLVVVGGGISGLSAAWFYREAHPGARILILENHDDFGGHAKRNEFRVGDRLLLGYGGSESLQSPKSTFSKETNRLLGALGVKISRFETAFDTELYPRLGLGRGLFFDRESFGVDRLVVGNPMTLAAATDADIPGGLESLIRQYPVSRDTQDKLIAFFSEPKDYLPGQSADQKKDYLRKTSYRDYLIRDVGLGEEGARTFEGIGKDYTGSATDVISSLSAAGLLFPGFDGPGLAELKEEEYEEPYIYHFPDGNASVARLLVRSLIPEAAKGHGMDDIVLADLRYEALDRPGNKVRLRLNSTAVSVANPKKPGGAADIGYVRKGEVRRVQARHVVLACYNMIIPHIMPELPEEQKHALSINVKVPLVYANVAIRDWRSLAKTGVSRIHCPTAFFSDIKLDYPVSMGGYAAPRDPSEPMLLHMVHVPVTPNQNLDNTTQCRLGRQNLLDTPYEEFETRIRDQLYRMLGASGFSSERDIAAITVNRWPHGYSFSPNPLFTDTDMGPLKDVARKRNGQVAIANSDAGWQAYAQAAIDEAWRAVHELKQA